MPYSILNKASIPPGPIRYNDPDYDETTVDFSDRDQVVLRQVDEAGNTHIVILSHRMISQVMPQFILWNSSNNQ